VTSHDIARAAGVASGTFYLHFPDKQALFREIVYEAIRQLRERLETAFESDDDIKVAVRAHAEALVVFAEVNADLVAARRDLDRARNDLEDQRTLVSGRMKTMYKAGQYTWLDLVTSASSLADAETVMDFLRRISLQDRHEETDLQELTGKARKLEHDVEAERKQAVVAQIELDDQRAQLEAKIAERATALKDTVAAETMVYYVIGTKDELKRKGLITEEGGSRVLFVLWRTGETVTPARDFDEAYFAAIDRRTTNEIPLPSPQGRYRIVSRHDYTLLATPHDERGRVQGAESLRISNSAEFWRPSKFLIILQEEPGAPVQGTD